MKVNLRCYLAKILSAFIAVYGIYRINSEISIYAKVKFGGMIVGRPKTDVNYYSAKTLS